MLRQSALSVMKEWVLSLWNEKDSM